MLCPSKLYSYPIVPNILHTIVASYTSSDPSFLSPEILHINNTPNSQNNSISFASPTYSTYLPSQSIKHPKALLNPPRCRGSHSLLQHPGNTLGTNSSIFRPVHTIVRPPLFLKQRTVMAVFVRHSSLRNGGSARMTSTWWVRMGGSWRGELKS